MGILHIITDQLILHEAGGFRTPQNEKRVFRESSG
jgi:hypothetical protein